MIIHNPILTGSLSLNGTNLSTSNIVTTGSNTFVGNQVVSGSFTVFTGSAVELQVLGTGVKIGNLSSDTHNVTGSLNVSGSIITPGSITAQTLVVQTITSSVDFVTGSTRFGSLSSNTHQFTGSMSVSGSIATGNLSLNGGTIQCSGDYYIGTNSANLIQFYTSNQNRVIITSGGNVGVGTTAPDLTLSVSGAINLRNTTRAGAFEIDSSGNLWIGTATTAGNIYLETGHSTTGLPSTGTARLTLNQNGATFSSAVTATQVNAIVGSGTARMQIGDGTISGGALLNLMGVSAAKAWFISSNYNVGGALEFIQSTTNGGTTPASSPAMIISSTGNVGIGTTSPASLLSIQRGSSGDNIELIGSGASGYSDILFYNTNKVTRLGYIDWSDTQVRWNVEANLPLVLYTNATERMRIRSGGEVSFIPIIIRII